MTRDAGRKLIPCDHSIENRCILRQSLIQRVRKNLRIVAIAPHVSTFRPRGLQNDQLARIPHRKPPQQHLIEQGKDRRIRADAQRQGQNRNECKARVLPEHPQAVAHVLQERVHLCYPPPGAAFDFSAGAKIGNPEFRSALEGRQYHYFKRTRSKASHADMSDRITLSPTFNPSKISTVFTELRPNFTLTRVASDPSSVTLKIPIVLFSCPCTGRPT